MTKMCPKKDGDPVFPLFSWTIVGCPRCLFFLFGHDAQHDDDDDDDDDDDIQQGINEDLDRFPTIKVIVGYPSSLPYHPLWVYPSLNIRNVTIAPGVSF